MKRLYGIGLLGLLMCFASCNRHTYPSAQGDNTTEPAEKPLGKVIPLTQELIDSLRLTSEDMKQMQFVIVQSINLASTKAWVEKRIGPRGEIIGIRHHPHNNHTLKDGRKGIWDHFTNGAKVSSTFTKGGKIWVRFDKGSSNLSFPFQRKVKNGSGEESFFHFAPDPVKGKPHFMKWGGVNRMYSDQSTDAYLGVYFLGGDVATSNPTFSEGIPIVPEVDETDTVSLDENSEGLDVNEERKNQENDAARTDEVKTTQDDNASTDDSATDTKSKPAKGAKINRKTKDSSQDSSNSKITKKSGRTKPN